MKLNEVEKLRKKNLTDLEGDILKARESLRSLRFDLESGKVKNSAAVRDTRREIALLKTLVNEKKRAGSVEPTEDTESNENKKNDGK